MIWILEDSYKTKLGGGQKVTIHILDILSSKKVRFFDSTYSVLEQVKEKNQKLLFTKMRSCGKSVGQNPSFSFSILEIILFPFLFIFNLFNLLKVLKKDNPKIIYCPHKKTLLYAILLRKLRLFKGKLVFHSHSVFPLGLFPNFFKAMIARNCDEILCVSQYIFDTMIGKRKLVYNPVSPALVEAFEKKNKIPLNSAQALKVAFIGSLLEWKGYDLFIKVARELHDRNLEFHIFTQNKDVRQSYPSYLKLHYAKPSEEIFHNIDILLICSRGEESFSLTALEAAFFNIPVIFPNQKAILEILTPGVSGEMYLKHDSEAMIKALKKVILNKDQYNSKNKNVLIKYSWEKFEKSIGGIFMEESDS